MYYTTVYQKSQAFLECFEYFYCWFTIDVLRNVSHLFFMPKSEKI
nr:MAG TPA: hypothetical protein [Inoviridae sp.]